MKSLTLASASAGAAGIMHASDVDAHLPDIREGVAALGI
jgi:hypothetical protein